MRLALLLGLLLLATAPSAGAAVDVTPQTKGSGSIVVEGSGNEVACDPSQSDKTVVSCLEAVPVADNETVTLRAIPATDPKDHWNVVGWDGTACQPVALVPELCIISDSLIEEGTASPVAVFDDAKAPTVHTVTEIRPGPQGAVTFEFAADEGKDDGATFECWLDEQPPADCTDGTAAYTGIALGSHTFYVRARDASEQVSKEDKATPFTIDAPIPESPGPPVVLPTPTFPPVPRVLGPNAVTAKVARTRTFSLGKVRLVCPAVKVPCAAKAVVKGRLRKGGRTVRLASKPLRLRPSSSTAVKLKLGRKVAPALRKRGRLKGVASLEIRAPDVTTRKDVAVTLRPARR